MSASSSDVRCLSHVVKLGLALVLAGWIGGAWYLHVHHGNGTLGAGSPQHATFLEHEAVEALRSEALNHHAAAAAAAAAASEAHAHVLVGSTRPPQGEPLREDSRELNKAPSESSKKKAASSGAAAAVTGVAKGALSAVGQTKAGKAAAGAAQELKKREADKAEHKKKLDAAVRALNHDLLEEASVETNDELPKNKAPIGNYSSTAGPPTIFLSIAAYREQRGPRTILGAFEKAKYPDRIYVGLYQQWDSKSDPDGTDFSKACAENPHHPLCSRMDHVSKVELEWQKSEGPCVARANAEQMFGGQDFAMQIDSHSTFVQDWDEMMIRMWAQTGNEYAVLSGYPRSEGEMGRSEYRNIPMICTAQMLDWSVRDMLKNSPGFSAMRPHPVRTPYFGAGLVFARGHRLRNVPYDPHLHYLFDGEEFDMAMRLFTHGYDIYAPNETPLYHFYSSPAMNKQMGIQKFWDYQWGKRFPIMFKSTRRIRHKMGLPEILNQDPKINDTDLTDFQKYAPGHKRTVQQYLDYAGIDYVHKKVKGACKEVRNKLAHVPWANPAEDPIRAKVRSALHSKVVFPDQLKHWRHWSVA